MELFGIIAGKCPRRNKALKPDYRSDRPWILFASKLWNARLMTFNLADPLRNLNRRQIILIHS